MKELGQIVFEMPPIKNNPRNSEGAFLQLKDGTIMFAYSHYTKDSHADGAPASIGIIFSKDEGKTWSDRKILFSPQEEKAQNLMSVSLIRLNNGDIAIFYLVKRGYENQCTLHMRHSSDEGKSWSDAISCISKPGYYVVNNDRVIILSSGKIMFLASKHEVLEENGEKRINQKGQVHYFSSLDNGKTWVESPNISLLNVTQTKSGLQEPGLILLKDNLLMAWARTDLGRQYQMFSKDQGKTWSQPEPSFFTSPLSPLSMKRNPYTGHLFAVWNPIPNYQTRKISKAGWGRSPLICAISEDEGASWSNFSYIETDEDAGFCYTAIHFTKDSILLAYCAGGKEDKMNCLTKLRIRRIDLSEIQNRE